MNKQVTLSALGSAVLLLGMLGTVNAGETPKPGKLTPEEQAALRSGLLLRFYRAADEVKSLDVRRTRLAALHVPQGEAASPWVPPGPFVTKLSGFLQTKLRSNFTFRLVGNGSAVLSLNGKEALKGQLTSAGLTCEEIELVKGYNRVEIVFTTPAKGDATLRVLWQGEGFDWEPLPPDLLFAREDDAELAAARTLREGRLLFATQGCARCHALPGTLKGSDAAMPEMQQRAPSLAGIGSRRQVAWLAAWIAEPQALRPEATMPQLLHGPTSKAQAADLAAYLATLKSDRPLSPRQTAAALVKQGQSLFEKIGCIACHGFHEPARTDAFGRLSLHHVQVKYPPGALAAYLRAPHEHYAWNRMPDFKLSEAEADSLSAYLSEQAKGSVAAVAAGEPVRGGLLFRELKCQQCHATAPTEAIQPPYLAAVSKLQQGCLAAEPSPQSKAPRFPLTPAQRTGLRQFLATDGQALTREAAAEFSQRQMQVLQCASCHRRDGALTRWHAVLEEETLLPEAIPPLTWAGEKLKPAWTTQLLQGKHEHRARPWLKARMPAFPARAELLAVGLSHEHGFGAAEDPRPAPDAKLAAIGQKLVPQQGGFNCINCHAVGKQPAIAPFEAPGINLLDAAVRVRHAYYQRWMLDPPRVDPTTRMPKLAPDGKMTPLQEVFEGDAVRQFDAIWHWIQSLPEKK